ncbi:hypothetical protein KIN20_037219 [Parelaphostrongylus tenuis]|uniref:RRM domain-containing protein n=1 Tax=Parelaphostrongylus tenuis TaxID=148309 RepID=A0AAD5REE5_PARTN|nr:hypothetical protein KIN20_037219 [Parelaphostrongylus tenuis]
MARSVKTCTEGEKNRREVAPVERVEILVKNTCRYALVSFESEDYVTLAIEILNGTHLCGVPIVIIPNYASIHNPFSLSEDENQLDEFS